MECTKCKSNLEDAKVTEMKLATVLVCKCGEVNVVGKKIKKENKK